MDKQIKRWMNRWINQKKRDRHIYGWKDEWTDGWIKRWMQDECMDREVKRWRERRN